MNDEHVKEASWVVQSVTGASAYMHGVNYDKEKFLRELQSIVEYVRSAQKGKAA